MNVLVENAKSAASENHGSAGC
uniref:Uncharacterized protein n=1 Tax=Anguilla anguilla TaxID=7936 RepID=A0A0E9QIH6_ANGAN